MTKCASCGAAGQGGKFCEECGKTLVASGTGSGIGAYRMHVVAVFLVVATALAFFAALSSNTSARSGASGEAAKATNTVSSGVDAGAGLSGSQTGGTEVPIAVAGSTPAAATGTAQAAGAVDSGDTRTLAASIQGMTCGSCSARITRAVSALLGVKSVDVSLASKSGAVVYDPSAVTKQKILDTITAAGYPATEVSDTASSASGQQAVAGSPAAGSAGGSCGGGGCGCGCGG